jgi:alpha-tubulin suppressor-like RCC1 family protein
MNISWPEIIPSLTGIRKISCGRYSSALDDQGTFYAWGYFNG